MNNHCEWMRKIFSVGTSWEHEERIGDSKTDKGEVVAPLRLLVKDHKVWSQEDGTPPLSCPVSTGNKGFNRHLSEIVSLILEPLGRSIGGNDIESTGELLQKVVKLNNDLKDGREHINVEKNFGESPIFEPSSSAPLLEKNFGQSPQNI